ncbi:MAG: hypothetical protein AAFP82_12825, partial [Bacteroidota bacterium]
MKQLSTGQNKQGIKPIIEVLANGLFVLLFIALPTSKGLVSVGLTGLLILCLIQLFLKRKNTPTRLNWLLYSPWILLFLLIVSFFNSADKATAWSVLYRQNTLLILPLALWIFRDLLKRRLSLYFHFFIASISFCSVLTLFFFFLPEDKTISIVTQLSFLQDYIVHEKQLAFGTYSPFLDRLHFSYLLGTALFLQLYFSLKKDLFTLTQVIYGSLFFLNLSCFLILGGRGAQLGFLASLSIWIMVIYWKSLHQQIAQKFSRQILK